MQKRNGKFYLVLWQAISSGTASNSAINPPYDYNNPTVNVTVTISGIKGTALAYTPSVDSDSVASFPSINSMTVNVPDHIYVIEITPAGNTGINGIASDSNLRVFPNPACDILTIESISMIKEITLFNSLGEKVYAEKNIQANNTDVIVRSLPSGIYFLNLVNDLMTKTIKINILK